MNKGLIESVLDRAQHLCELGLKNCHHLLAGRCVSTLFFEPSTRTKISFELAAKRMGAIVMPFHMESSSLKKGESLIDTVQSLESMGIRFFVVRHSQAGTSQKMVQSLRYADSHVINAGEGICEHPTQALIDLFTLWQAKKQDFRHLRVAIVGNIAHSRVARSYIYALRLLEVAEIRVIGPDVWLPDDLKAQGVTTCTNLIDGLKEVDAVTALRIQKERIQADKSFDEHAFTSAYCLTEAIINTHAPKAVVMHPGPVNRGIEICSKLIDSPRSLIQKQVFNSIAVRMAIFTLLSESHTP